MLYGRFFYFRSNVDFDSADSSNDVPLVEVNRKMYAEMIEDQESPIDDSDNDPDYIQPKTKGKKGKTRFKLFSKKAKNSPTKRHLKKGSKSVDKIDSKRIPEKELHSACHVSKRDDFDDVDEIIVEILEDMINKTVMKENEYSKSGNIIALLIDDMLKDVCEKPKDILIDESYGREESPGDEGDDSTRSRKRKREPQLSKRITQKRMRYSGQRHHGPSGKLHEAKKVGETCGNKCKLGCSEKFNNEKRQDIFNFRKIGIFRG